MKDNSTKMLILLLFIFVLAIVNSIINDKVSEYFIALFITMILSYVFNVIKKYIFAILIKGDCDIMLKKVNVIYEFEKMKTYDDFLMQKHKIITKHNDDYYLRISRFFYFNYKFDIKKYSDFKELLDNEQFIIDEIIKTIDSKKEKEYKLLKKNFKIIRRNINYDRNFQRDYLEWKSGVHTSEFRISYDIVILSVITIISFLISVSVSVINVDINLLVKVTIFYTITVVFMQSFMAVLDYSSYRIDQRRKLEAILENLHEKGEKVE